MLTMMNSRRHPQYIVKGSLASLDGWRTTLFGQGTCRITSNYHHTYQICHVPLSIICQEVFDIFPMVYNLL